MEDEGKRNDEVTRGEQAKLILDNPLLKKHGRWSNLDT
jgi:hypothetical protein